jgi:hypothetical protein
MPRHVPEQGEPVNGDSFLDIVASVVSIMIIMVVMEGMRIKNAPVSVSIPADPAATELNKDLDDEKSLQSDVWKIEGEVHALEREAAARGAQRDYLATVVSAAEHELKSRREKLDSARQNDFDLSRNLSESQFQLEQLQRRREQLENQPAAAPVVVESYPTPISHAVDGPEAHIMISAGRVVFVPMDQLIERLKQELHRQAYRLGSRDEWTDTVGPIDGFRVRYKLVRRDIPLETARETGRGGTVIRIEEFSLIPTADDLGEPVRLALEEGSDFRRQMAKTLPGRTTVTIWVYPNGFDAFRQVRKELYRQGYAIAARPLPAGEHISGSPDGSKSAAQ